MLVAYVILADGFHKIYCVQSENIGRCASRIIVIRVQSKQYLILSEIATLLQIANVIVVVVEHFDATLSDQE